MRIIIWTEVSGVDNPCLIIYGNYRKTIFLAQRIDPAQDTLRDRDHKAITQVVSIGRHLNF